MTSKEYVEQVYGTATLIKAMDAEDALSILDLMQNFSDANTKPLEHVLRQLCIALEQSHLHHMAQELNNVLRTGPVWVTFHKGVSTRDTPWGKEKQVCLEDVTWLAAMDWVKANVPQDSTVRMSLTQGFENVGYLFYLNEI